jgi:hypothetical protein
MEREFAWDWKWLELEVGVTPLFGRHSTEWNTDLLFKKPWTLPKKAELMLGVGPEWVHATKYSGRRTPGLVKWCWILCSGPPRNVDSVGMSNRATTTALGGGMSNHWA